MISRSAVLQRPSRKIVLLTKIKSTAAGLGARTMSFFRKGEELEATEYENLPHDDPMLVPPKLGFRNFESVPRNHKPLVIMVLLGVAALSVLGWRLVRKAPGEEARAATSAAVIAPRR